MTGEEKKLFEVSELIEIMDSKEFKLNKKELCKVTYILEKLIVYIESNLLLQTDLSKQNYSVDSY